MGSPSTQDYTPVPAEPVDETINDGVEATQDEAEASDDEGIYGTSAPLLSRRTRGNDTPCPHHRGPWHRFVGLFRRPAWTNAKASKRSWARISIMGFIGLLLTTVVALSISTGLLARRPDHCPSYSYRSYQPRTRIPLNQPWTSSNNRLDFFTVYPPLVNRPSSSCLQAWNSLSYIPCHEKIWNRSWDNGKHETLFELDPSEYSGPMCSRSCTDAINRAYQLIWSQCTPEDKFDMEGYVGPFTADPGLEDGPVGVISTIQRRLQHTCRQSPLSYYSADYCVSNMYEDWFVVDGMNAANLEGLDLIEGATRVSKTVPARYHYRSSSDTCDDTWHAYTGRREERRFGPGVNQTSCSWCTIDWFDRKLQSWEKDKVVDPKNGTVVALPDYLRRIRHVGQRCQSNDWNRIYGQAIFKYKSAGLLPPDWKDDGDDGSAKKPCKTKPSSPGQPDQPNKPWRKVPYVKPVSPVKPVKPVNPVEPIEPLEFVEDTEDTEAVEASESQDLA